MSAGVHPTRISSSAHGEAIAQNPDVDSYALERRVSVKLFIDERDGRWHPNRLLEHRFPCDSSRVSAWAGL